MKQLLKRAIIEIRSHWHWIAGGIAGFVTGLGTGPAIGGAAGMGGFIAYEVKQDKDTGTKSYKDILEFVCAYFIGLATMIPLTIIGVLK